MFPLLAADTDPLSLTDFVPAAVVIVVVFATLLVARAVIENRRKRSPTQSFAAQITTLVVLGVGLYALVLAIPMDATQRSDLLNVLGLAFTAAFAFSSTTLVGNAMAGLMLRVVRNFKPGDFIRVGDDFGRVTEQELFHTEIQTEDRDLTTLPNLHLVTHPVNVIRSEGTLIDATVSLGYDVPHARAEAALVDAAAAAGLTDGHVLVRDLGDFAVTYRVAGFLEDVKRLLSMQSQLRRCMLDELHRAGIEIVSPSFVNQRRISTDAPVMAAPDADPRSTRRSNSVTADVLAFDKADRAEAIEHLAEKRSALEEEIEELRGKLAAAEDDEKDRIRLQITQRSAHVKAIEGFLERE